MTVMWGWECELSVWVGMCDSYVWVQCVGGNM